ncbi:MAG TPA: LPXTG cell wall anchor domain-containing protein [Ilumatobacteraceae bacterium]|nr:LPXTG cell wall anchor domain-containing protein [Ilumatobacteraceae bacterium]
MHDGLLLAGVQHHDSERGGPYYPPDPPPQHVEAGVKSYGHFPLPGLYMGPTSPGLPPTMTMSDVELKLTVDSSVPFQAGSDPVLSFPAVNGEPDSFIDAAIIDHAPALFVGIATFHVQLCGSDPTNGGASLGCHTFNLVLYVGVDLPVVEDPVTGAATGTLVASGAAALLLGGGMIVLSRRRRVLPIRVR